MTRRCTAYIEELQQWHAHLLPQQSLAEPPAHLNSSKRSEYQIPSSELAFFLLTRYVGVMEWIQRPFLYACPHGHGPDTHFAHNNAHYDNATNAYIRRMAAQAIARHLHSNCKRSPSAWRNLGAGAKSLGCRLAPCYTISGKPHLGRMLSDTLLTPEGDVICKPNGCSIDLEYGLAQGRLVFREWQRLWMT